MTAICPTAWRLGAVAGRVTTRRLNDDLLHPLHRGPGSATGPGPGRGRTQPGRMPVNCSCASVWRIAHRTPMLQRIRCCNWPARMCAPAHGATGPARHQTLVLRGGGGTDVQVREALALIARLEPKPARQFSDVERNAVVPDVLVVPVQRQGPPAPRFERCSTPTSCPRLRVHDVRSGGCATGAVCAMQRAMPRCSSNCKRHAGSSKHPTAL